MQIGVDLTVSRINQAGTGIYAASLIAALQEVDVENVYHVFSLPQQRDMSRRKTWHSRKDTIYRDLIWTHVLLPWQVYSRKIDVLHMPAGVIPIYLPCPTVVTIFDTTIFHMPQNFTAWHRNYASRFTRFAAKRASRIITISEHSKRDIVKQFGIEPRKVVVTYLAPSSKFVLASDCQISEVKKKYNLDSFILTVGTLEPRKNIARLLEAFARIRGVLGHYRLVHVGPRGWLFEDILAQVERLDLQNSVRFLGRVPLYDLVQLYNAASVFVYPSLYEGFGLPVLEAMACGCPVVTSNTSSLPEVVGTAGVMIDPCSVEQLADAIREVLENGAFAKDLRDRGLERARLFSWHRCAQETLSVYYQACNSGFGA